MNSSEVQRISVVAVLYVIVICGCATAPKENPDVNNAREAVERAGNDAVVVENAPVALREAEESLAETEMLWQDKADQLQIQHQAYLTVQKARIAEEKGLLNAAEKEVAKAEQERQLVLLQARDNQIKKLQAMQTERGLVLTLGDVLFDVGQADLKQGGFRVVDRLSVFLSDNPKRRVRIEGHTDSTGSPDFNQSLSERRASAVRDALAQRGISYNQVEVIGYGSRYPVATNATAAGRQQNRRVEVVISDELGRITERN